MAVVQALPKGDRAELAVELLTELGADEIVPWASARSIVQWTGERGARALAKWQRRAENPLASTAVVDAARVLVRTCEGLATGLAAPSSS